MTNKKISALTSATTPLAGTETLPIVQSSATVKVAVSDLTAGRAVEVGKLYSGIAYNSGRRVNTQASAGETAAYIGGVNGYILVDNVDSGNSYASQSVGFTVQDMAGNPVATFSSSSKDINFYGNLIQTTAAKGVNFTANTPAAGMTSQLLNWYEEGTWTPTITFSGLAVGITYATQTGYYVRVGKMVHVSGRIDLSSKGVSVGDAQINGMPFSAAVVGGGSVGFQLSFAPTNKQVMLTVSGTSLIVRYADGTTTSISQASDFANNSICIFSATYRI